MDKYEYKVRADEIKSLIEKGDFTQAAEIADTIDWRKVKSVKMLCTISDLYKINRRYEDARDLLLLAYERRPEGRNICYSLCELSIKTGEFLQAMEYYKEFARIAPKDPGIYILQYKLYEDQDVSLEERIDVLEELKRHDYREKWAYELAYLYHRVGLATRCVEECDEMILWFGDGDYVIKAMELKMLHQPLTPDQQEKYDHRFDKKEEVSPEVDAAEDKVGAEAVAVAEESEGVTGDTITYKPIRVSDTGSIEVPAEDEEEDVPELEKTQVIGVPKEVAEAVVPQMADPVGMPEGMEIQVNVGEYNTINLQEELAHELKQFFGDEAVEPEVEEEAFPTEETYVEDTAEIGVEPDAEEDFDEADEPETVSEPEEIEESEVFFGETGEIVMEQMREAQESETTSSTAKVVFPELVEAQPPKEMAGVLSQEADGQISIVLPEKTDVEKQITGQMNIEDVLAEWERMKKENEKKRQEEVRQHVLQQTGSMFTEFEASVRDGLLEKLEKDAAEASEEEVSAVEVPVEETPAEDVAAETVEEPVLSAEDEVEEIAEVEEPSEEITEGVVEEETEVEVETEETVFEEEESETEAVEDEEPDEEASVAEESEEELTTEDEVEEPEAEESEAQEPAEEETAVETTHEMPGVKTRPMTREEKELFGSYIQSRNTRDQIVHAIDDISLAPYTGNVIITGAVGVDTLPLAKGIIREIQMSDSNFSGKVAKISGQGLNRKNIEETLQQLQNGALIVQNACDLDEKTIEDLQKALQKETFGIVILLQDDTKTMDKFLQNHEALLSIFTARVDVAALSNDMLVAFGKKYAREQEFSIDTMGTLALHNRIEQRQTIDHAVTTAEVMEIVDEAIRHASRKTPGHFFDILFSKRYDEEDMIIVTEKDFV